MNCLQLRSQAARVITIAPRTEARVHLFRALLRTFGIWPMLLLAAAIMGSIVTGLATPTEAAAGGVLTTIFVGFIWGNLTWRRLLDAFSTSTRTFASIGFVIVGAVSLGQSISVLGLPRDLLETVTAVGFSKHELLFVVIVLYIFLGFFFEGLSLVLMTLSVVYLPSLM